MLAQVPSASLLAGLVGPPAETPSPAGAGDGEFAGLLQAQVDAGSTRASPAGAPTPGRPGDAVPDREPIGAVPLARPAVGPLDLAAGVSEPQSARERSVAIPMDLVLPTGAVAPAWAALTAGGLTAPSGQLADTVAAEPATGLLLPEHDRGDDAAREQPIADAVPLPIAAAATFTPSLVLPASTAADPDPTAGAPVEAHHAASGEPTRPTGPALATVRADDERSMAPVQWPVPEPGITNQPPEPAALPAGTSVVAPELGVARPGQNPPPNAPPIPWQGRVDARPGSAEFAPTFGLQVSALARDGVQHARLHLNPVELGPIVVKIALDGGNARIDFHADAAQTRAAIEASLPALAGAMRDAGLTLAGGGVFQQPQDASAWSGQPGGASGDAATNARPTWSQREQLRGDDEPPLGPLQAIPMRRGLVDLIA